MHSLSFSTLPSPPPLPTTNLLSVLIQLPILQAILQVSYTWNHILCCLLYRASINQHNAGAISCNFLFQFYDWFSIFMIFTFYHLKESILCNNICFYIYSYLTLYVMVLFVQCVILRKKQKTTKQKNKEKQKKISNLYLFSIMEGIIYIIYVIYIQYVNMYKRIQ